MKHLRKCPLCGDYEEEKFFTAHICKLEAECVKLEYMNRGGGDARLTFWVGVWGTFMLITGLLFAVSLVIFWGLLSLLCVLGLLGTVLLECRKAERNKKDFEKEQPVIAKLLE